MSLDSGQQGTLYGVGIGPGDPELLTLKAARIIQACPVISYIQNPQGYSLSRSIAEEHLSDQHIELPITFRMSRDRSQINHAYDQAYQAIQAYLAQGHNVAMLCEGDPLFYGSFNYLLERLSAEFNCEIIPGINSVLAVAAATKQPLIQQDESLAVLSARNSDAEILRALNQHNAVAILKAGPQRQRLVELIKQSQRWKDACYVTRATQASEQVYLRLDDLPEEAGDYFGMLLVRPTKTEPSTVATASTRPVVISLTEPGKALAEKLSASINIEHWHKPQPFQAQLQSVFKQGRRILLICATGIAMRTLAPVLKDKYSDPAVLVLDELGNNVIPLLSGHEGGANQWAAEIAEITGGQAVITSARQYLKPTWVVGMGCERNCPETVLADLLNQALSEAGLRISDLSAITSIDVKADETGLIQLAASLNIPFITYSATQLRQVENQLQTPSDIVFKEVGCYGVAEGSSLFHAQTLSANQEAELILPKQKNRQATVAIARAYLE